jgi:aryl carrier-like protein
MIGLQPKLVGSDTKITNLYCDSAVVLAAAWQRMNRRADAERLLERVAAWLDGPRGPRWPQARLARAQVHALLGESDAAFGSLEQAFAAGFRGVNAATLTYRFHYRGEDNPLFANIRNDPRFAAWYARMRADAARQLAQAKQQEAAGKESPTTATSKTI